MKNQNIVSIFSLSASDGNVDRLPPAEKSIKMKLIMRNEPNLRRAKNDCNRSFDND
jgi:hypothetical protein